MHVHHLQEEAMTVVSGTLSDFKSAEYDKFKDAPEPVMESQAAARHSTSAV